MTKVLPVIILRQLILNLYINAIVAFYLRFEHERVQKHRCDSSLDIWYNEDLISYSKDDDASIDSVEKRLLTGRHAEKSEEHTLGTYFLDTSFPYSNLFLGGLTEQEGDDEKLPVAKRWKRILVQVAAWMIEHKYLESDPRVFAKIAEVPQDRFFQRVLYRHFPIPVLKDFHPIVEEQCRKGLLQCLKLVHQYAYAHSQQFNRYLNSDHDYFIKQYKKLNLPKKYMNSRNVKMLALNALTFAKRDFCEVQGDLGWTWFQGQKYIPFLSRNDLFEFRTTASYFLCNYTLLQKSSYEHMGFPGTLDAGSRSQGNSGKAVECYTKQTGESVSNSMKIYRRENLTFTMATMNGFKCTKQVGLCQRPIDRPLGEKYKDDETFWDFSCAMTAFCPDPCCGAYKNPMDDPSDIGNCGRKSLDFPCHNAGQTDDCQFEGKKNKNFFDLIQNRANITCGCNAKEGKVWDSQFSTCMDVDECVETNPCKADTEVCINRLNGKAPLCVCEFGYYRKPESTSKTCEPDPNSGLFRDIDVVEKRMKELYGPIEEGKPPDIPAGKAGEVDAMKQALNNLKLSSRSFTLHISAPVQLAVCIFLILKW